MSQSLSGVYLHYVFSIKHCLPLLVLPLRNDVHSYIAGIAHRLHCPAICVGGTADHVHVLLRHNRTISPAEVAKELKRNSSIMIHQRADSLSDLSWQAGYGLFSVSSSLVESVSTYIQNQEQHHKSMSFQDEYRRMLEQCGMSFDEKYVWD